jgi:hypothetical protein
MPILFMSSTSPRLEVGMCASGNPSAPDWQVSLCGCRLLPGGLTIKCDFHLSCTSSMNRARRRAASRGVGVTSLGVGMAIVISSSTSGYPTRGGVSFGSSCTSDNGGKPIVR